MEQDTMEDITEHIMEPIMRTMENITALIMLTTEQFTTPATV